jgi:hypothetical protein
MIQTTLRNGYHSRCIQPNGVDSFNNERCLDAVAYIIPGGNTECTNAFDTDLTNYETIDNINLTKCCRTTDTSSPPTELSHVAIGYDHNNKLKYFAPCGNSDDCLTKEQLIDENAGISAFTVRNSGYYTCLVSASATDKVTTVDEEGNDGVYTITDIGDNSNNPTCPDMCIESGYQSYQKELQRNLGTHENLLKSSHDTVNKNTRISNVNYDSLSKVNDEINMLNKQIQDKQEKYDIINRFISYLTWVVVIIGLLGIVFVIAFSVMNKDISALISNATNKFNTMISNNNNTGNMNYNNINT